MFLQGGRLSQQIESMISISVPSHAYLRKFLVHRANSKDGHIVVSTLTSYGIHLIKNLQRKAIYEPRLNISGFKDHIDFKLSELIYTRSGIHLSKQNIFFFNQAIKSEFDDHIYEHALMNILTNPNTTIEKEISFALHFYGISEADRTMETMLKAYQRWRKERNMLLVRV